MKSSKGAQDCIRTYLGKYFALLAACTICRYDGEVVDEKEVYNLCEKCFCEEESSSFEELSSGEERRKIIFQNGC